MAEKPYTANDVAAIDAAKFQPLQKIPMKSVKRSQPFINLFPRFMASFEKEQSRGFLNHFVADHYCDLNHYDFCLAT